MWTIYHAKLLNIHLFIPQMRWNMSEFFYKVSLSINIYLETEAVFPDVCEVHEVRPPCSDLRLTLKTVIYYYYRCIKIKTRLPVLKTDDLRFTLPNDSQSQKPAYLIYVNLFIASIFIASTNSFPTDYLFKDIYAWTRSPFHLNYFAVSLCSCPQKTVSLRKDFFFNIWRVNGLHGGMVA